MKYFSYYDTQCNRRSMSLAAVNKINYIAKTLKKYMDRVDIIACGMNADINIDANVEELDEGIYINFFKTRKTSGLKIGRIFSIVRNNIVLFLYLLKNTNKDEQIIVYHSLGIMRCVYWAKKIKKFRLILEVEEFYNDVVLKSKLSRSFEEKIIKCADKYIFPTELLNEKFNKANKPYCIIHGTYQVEEDRNVSFNDDKIHIVYAGTLEPRKGGATTATAALYLPKNYHVHILGFGNPKEIEELIYDVNSKSEATVTFDGLLSGSEYIEFLQKCHIGMSTQNPNADFNDTSFPSKILSYMSNGLRVVTVKIPAIVTSLIGNDVYYYDKQLPQEIAKTIEGIDFNDGYDGRKKISVLDEEFCVKLKKILEV